MNNNEEIIEVIGIALLVAAFLIKSGRALKAIELCKESLFLLNNKGLRIKQQFGKLIYREIFQKMFVAYCLVHDYTNAITYGRKLQVIYCECGDKVKEGHLTMQLAHIYHNQYKYDEGEKLFTRAIILMREIGDKKEEAYAYGKLGIVYRSRGENVKAKEYFEKALAMTVEIGDRGGEARSYGSLGVVFQSLGGHVKAKEYLEKALAISMEIGVKEAEAANYANLGIAFHHLGQHIMAKEYHEKALAIEIEIGDRAGEAKNYVNLGSVFKSLGEYVKAKEYYDRALAINVEIRDRPVEAAGYENLGALFFSLGENVKAKRYFEKALLIFMEIGDRAGEAEQYRCLGTVYLALGKYGKSNEYLEKALVITMEIGDRNMEAMVYVNLGTVLEFLGDNFKAKEYYEKALAIATEVGNRELEKSYYVKLGSMFLSLGRFDMAEKNLIKALLMIKDIRGSRTDLHCYCCLALTKLSQGESQEAFFYLFRSIEQCEEMRVLNADNDEIKISLADKHVFPYKLLSRLFRDARNPNNALYVEELERARALADLMATQYSAEKVKSANPQSWIGIENVMTKERNCTFLYISYHVQRVLLWILKTNGAISYREITVNKNTLNKKLAKPAENLDEFFAIVAENFRTFGNLPEEICENRSLNDIEPAESDSSKKESLTFLQQGMYEENLKQSLTLFHEMLINPVSNFLEEPEIIISPDRNLYRVPFAALLDESGKYLSETFRIRIVPSLMTLKLIQDSPADYHRQTGTLIVGDPLNNNFKPLPGARKEAEMIGQQLGVQPLLGKEATKQAVLQRIDSVRLIHFAAHGNAEKGEIALASPSSTTEIPQDDDYLLKISDISKVHLRAKLVVLSCCHSGRGQIRAEGVVGIARAFLGSGARSVLASLWALEDSATRQFMNCFYEHLVRGESASESLHQAMKWMRGNGFTKVSEWAPFILIGDNVTFNFGK